MDNNDEIFVASPSLEEFHGVEIIPETNRGRGKSFSIVEDEALCKCWLAISQDPEIGINQPMSVFWDRVHTLFLSQPGVQANRTVISVSHRWSLIQKSVNKFCGYYEQVQNRSQSGTVESDKVSEAKRMYFRILKKNFIYDTCWEILRRSCKWDEIRTQSQKSTSQKSTSQTSPSSLPSTPLDSPISLDSDIDLEQPSSADKGKRPMGQKAAKEARSKRAVHDVRFEAMAATQEKIVEVLADMSSKSFEKEQHRAANHQRRAENREAQLQMLAEMNAREQRKEDHLIMSMNMSDLTPLQRSYYEDLQRQIISRNRESGF